MKKKQQNEGNEALFMYNGVKGKRSKKINEVEFCKEFNYDTPSIIQREEEKNEQNLPMNFRINTFFRLQYEICVLITRLHHCSTSPRFFRLCLSLNLYDRHTPLRCWLPTFRRTAMVQKFFSLQLFFSFFSVLFFCFLSTHELNKCHLWYYG